MHCINHANHLHLFLMEHNSIIIQGDWVVLAYHLDLTDSDILLIKQDYPNNLSDQALAMMHLWYESAGEKATGNLRCKLSSCLFCPFPRWSVGNLKKLRLTKYVLNADHAAHNRINLFRNGEGRGRRGEEEEEVDASLFVPNLFQVSR